MASRSGIGFQVYQIGRRLAVCVLFLTVALPSFGAAPDEGKEITRLFSTLTKDLPPSGEITDDHKKALADLKKLTAAGREKVGAKLLDAMYKQGDSAKATEKQQHSAATVLGNMVGEKEFESVRTALFPNVLKGLKDDDILRRFYSANLLGHIGDEKAVGALLLVARADTRSVRTTAAQALISIGEKSGYGPFLETLLRPRPHVDLLEIMQDTEGSLKDRVEATIDPLIQMMKGAEEESFAARHLAARALGESKSRKAIPALIDRIKDAKNAFSSNSAGHETHYHVRQQAIASLIELGKDEPLGKEIRTELLKPETFALLQRDFLRPGVSNDDVVRQELGRLLGWIGDKRAIPALTAVLENQKGIFSEFVQGGATAGLSEFAKRKEFHADLVKAFLPHITSEKTALEGGALEIVEQVRDHMEKKDAEKLDGQIREALAKRGAKLDLCAAACKLAGQAENWIAEKHYEIPEQLETDHPEDTWRLSIKSLGLLFLMKTRPFCEAAVTKDHLAGLKGDLFGKDSPMRAMAKTVRGKSSLPDGSPLNPTVVFAKQFYGLLLRDLLATDLTLTADQKQILRDEIKLMDESLKGNLSVYEKGGESHPFRGSVMHTFAFSSSILANEKAPEAALKHLRDLVDKLTDPSSAKYYPTTGDGTDRGGALRSVTLQLAAYQRAEGKETDKRRDDLFKSLLALKEKHFIWAALAHAKRSGTHGFSAYSVSKDQIAPYYFWANIPYVTSAIEVLAKDPKLSAEKKKQLEGVRDEVRGAILTLIHSNGLFTPLHKETYPSSITYANALGGLALLPFIESCGGKAVARRSNGIIDVSASTGKAADEARPHVPATPEKKPAH